MCYVNSNRTFFYSLSGNSKCYLMLGKKLKNTFSIYTIIWVEPFNLYNPLTYLLLYNINLVHIVTLRTFKTPVLRVHVNIRRAVYLNFHACRFLVIWVVSFPKNSYLHNHNANRKHKHINCGISSKCTLCVNKEKREDESTHPPLKKSLSLTDKDLYLALLVSYISR